MTPMLDPFYGVYRPGVVVAKWLNRILLVAEIAVIVKIGKEFGDLWMEWWQMLLFLVLSYVGINVLNFAIRILWNIVMVIIYGTTDVDEIEETHDRWVGRLHRRD